MYHCLSIVKYNGWKSPSILVRMIQQDEAIFAAERCRCRCSRIHGRPPSCCCTWQTRPVRRRSPLPCVRTRLEVDAVVAGSTPAPSRRNSGTHAAPLHASPSTVESTRGSPSRWGWSSPSAASTTPYAPRSRRDTNTAPSTLSTAGSKIPIACCQRECRRPCTQPVA